MPQWWQESVIYSQSNTCSKSTIEKLEKSDIFSRLIIPTPNRRHSSLLNLNKTYALCFILTLNMYLPVWKNELKVQKFDILETVNSEKASTPTTFVFVDS